MKKHLSTIVRTAIAIAGVAYIVWMVDLADRVEVPAGTSLPDGRILTEATAFPIVGGTYHPDDRAGELVLDIGTGGSGSLRMSIPQAALGVEPGGLRFLPGLMNVVLTAEASMLLAGLLIVAVIYPILMVRWWLLMQARHMFVPLGKAFRLTMVGNFFNFCIPGTTGGDLVKAYYAAKGSGRRADAVMTVVVDRACGLSGLLILAGVVGLFIRNDPTAYRLTIYVWLIIACVIVGAALYFSTRMRAAMGLDWLVDKLPAKNALGAIDRAAMAYRHHILVVWVAILMSVVLHVALVSATAMAGYALGMGTPVHLLMIVTPVVFLVGALPLAPQGVGVMELFAVTMLRSPLASANQIIGMLVMIRLYQLFYSLLGSLFLLRGDIHLHPQETPQAAGS